MALFFFVWIVIAAVRVYEYKQKHRDVLELINERFASRGVTWSFGKLQYFDSIENTIIISFPLVRVVVQTPSDLK